MNCRIRRKAIFESYSVSFLCYSNRNILLCKFNNKNIIDYSCYSATDAATPMQVIISILALSSKIAISIPLPLCLSPQNIRTHLLRFSQTTISECLLGMGSDHSILWIIALLRTNDQPIVGYEEFWKQLMEACRWVYHSKNLCFCLDGLY